MKKIFISFVILLNTFALKAQLSPHPVGSYILRPELDKFVGTWKWSSGTDSLQIILQKQKIHYPTPLDYDQDGLVGWHRYIKNGVLVESSIQYLGSSFYEGNYTIFPWSDNGSPTKLFGTFWDLSKNKRCNIYLTMTNTGYTQMNWLLRNPRGINPDGFQPGFTLPVNLTLIKQ